MYVYHRYISQQGNFIGQNLGCRLCYYSNDGDNKSGVITASDTWIPHKEVVVAIVQSLAEAIWYAHGVANGHFVPMPVDYEYPRHPGLKAIVEGGR